MFLIMNLCHILAHLGARRQGCAGKVTPKFETMLLGLAEGQLCPVPVKTRYGVRVIHLHRRIPGQTLPFEMVQERIADYLGEASWRRGVSHYTGLLIADAEISGIGMGGFLAAGSVAEHIMSISISKIFERNRLWAEEHLKADRAYFQRLKGMQEPDYLWIGCADSRVPANVITGLEPGEVFVHRNVANVVHAGDMNCMAVMQYAIEYLHIKHIVVCGHYGCGGVRAAMEAPDHGLVDYWLDPVRATARENDAELAALKSGKAREDRLCELNVRAQVRNVCHSTVVQRAWARREELAVHGWIYGLHDGLLHDLECDVSRASAG